MATFFDKQYLGRPCLLLLIWTLGILGFLFLLFGMMIDELTSGTLTVSGAVEYKVTCSSSTFDTEPGALNTKYVDTGYTYALLQKQAGSAWLAFGILSCLFSPFLLYGIMTDYYAGELGHKKPSQFWENCCMLKTWGYTRIAALLMTLLQLLQIIIYSAANQCGSDAFYDELFGGTHSDLTTIGGGSFVMVVMSLLFFLGIFVFILWYQYTINEELPIGEKKQSPAQFNKESVSEINFNADGPKSTTQGRPEPPKSTTQGRPEPPKAQAPESEVFQPKRNLTFMSEGDFTGAAAGHDRALSMLAGQASQMTMDGDRTTAEYRRPTDPVPMPPPKKQQDAPSMAPR
eukprot:59597_1